MQLRFKERLTGHPSSIFIIIPYKSASSFLAGDGAGNVIHWDLKQTDSAKLLAKVPSNIFSLLYLEEYAQLIAGTLQGILYFIDIKTNKVIQSFQAHEKGIFDLKLLNQKLYVAGADGDISIWDINKRQQLNRISLSEKSIRTLLVKDRKLIAGSSDGHLYFIDIKKNENISEKSEDHHASSIFSIVESEQYILSASRDASIKVWDEDCIVHSIPAHMFTVNDLSIHPEKKLFASASRDKSIKIWDAETYNLLKVADQTKEHHHINSVNCLWWSSFQNLLVSGSDDRTLMIWSIIDKD